MKKKERRRVKDAMIAGQPISVFAGRYTEQQLKEVYKTLTVQQRLKMFENQTKAGGATPATS